jgi:hypothetical protein
MDCSVCNVEAMQQSTSTAISREDAAEFKSKPVTAVTKQKTPYETNLTSRFMKLKLGLKRNPTLAELDDNNFTPEEIDLLELIEWSGSREWSLIDSGGN